MTHAIISLITGSTYTILLSRERVNKGTKRMNSLRLSLHLISFILRDFTGKTTACALSKKIFDLCRKGLGTSLALQGLVQSLNSPFFPPHIGAEPWRAKEESRITCMRMLRTPPFFPPKSGENPYLEVFSRFGLWRDFLNDKIQATISAFRLIKNM